MPLPTKTATGGLRRGESRNAQALEDGDLRLDRRVRRAETATLLVTAKPADLRARKHGATLRATLLPDRSQSAADQCRP